MWKFILSLFKSEPNYQNLGALLNTEEELAELPHFEEIVAKANAVDWSKALNVNKFNFKVRNQDGSSSCVAFTRALVWSIMYYIRTGIWVDFSAKWPYQYRSNKPDGGMYAQDVLDKGMIPDDLMPSDNLSEEKMNLTEDISWLKEVAKVFEMGTPIVLPIRNIDTVASVIETTGKPIQAFFQFGPGEWFGLRVPKIIGTALPYGHSVTILPEYGMYNNEKAILIQDSAHTNSDNKDGKRIITNSFFAKRNCFVQYWMRFKFEGQSTKPTYTGTTKSLQECLRYEGLFPSNISLTDTFGPITKQAVIDFQKKYNLNPPLGNVGPLTTKKLQELYN